MIWHSFLFYITLHPKVNLQVFFLMGKKKVTIQGVEGCFHDAAAREFFSNEDIETVPCESFPLMVDMIRKDPSLIGIMAIENTIAGSLLQNHELIHQAGLVISGEYKMRISHVLCALPGQRLDSLSEVNSHPIALMQCEEFLRSHPNLKMIEKFDTAGSAREIAEHRLEGHAAICGEYAARLYGLEIIEKGIETNKRNFTRFLIVRHPDSDLTLQEGSRADKASIVFTLPHTQGALSKVLTILAFYDLNLTKIQSFPIVGREWEYKFYIDLAFDDAARFRLALEAARPLTSQFKILGEYPSCKKIL